MRSHVVVELRPTPQVDAARLKRLMRDTGFRPVAGRTEQYSLQLETDAGPDQIAEMTQTTLQHFAEVAGATDTSGIARICSINPA